MYFRREEFKSNLQLYHSDTTSRTIQEKKQNLASSKMSHLGNENLNSHATGVFHWFVFPSIRNNIGLNYKLYINTLKVISDVGVSIYPSYPSPSDCLCSGHRSCNVACGFTGRANLRWITSCRRLSGCSLLPMRP